MCGRRLKIFFLSLVLFSALPCLPSFSSCYADVILSDKEAEEMLNEIQESKKDLNQVKTELSESKKESQELKTELEDVKNDYNEQKISYEEQLKEAERKNKVLTGTTIAGGSASAVLLVIVIVMSL